MQVLSRRTRAVGIGAAILAGLVVQVTPAAAAVSCNLEVQGPYRWVSVTERVYVGISGQVRCSGAVDLITITNVLFRNDTAIATDTETAVGPVLLGNPLLSMIQNTDVACAAGQYRGRVSAKVSTFFADEKTTPTTTINIC